MFYFIPSPANLVHSAMPTLCENLLRLAPHVRAIMHGCHGGSYSGSSWAHVSPRQSECEERRTRRTRSACYLERLPFV